jgi:hypothetical protein
MNINQSWRLPEDQYFPQRTTKSGIALHHTVGGTARSTFEYWKSNREMVGTAYIIDRDGSVYEVFDPSCWAWQFGLRWPDDKKVAFEKRFIGIEIASEGGMKEVGQYCYCFDRVCESTKREKAHLFNYIGMYRGYQFFDSYDDRQTTSVITLVNELCQRFDIPRAAPTDTLAYYGDRLSDFRGVLGHANLRWDKSDPNPDRDFWNRVISRCSLSPVAIEDELSALSRLNGAELQKLAPPAGSMVKGLLFELQRGGRDTYIQLRDAAPGGQRVAYSLVHGDPNLVTQVSRALGFKEGLNSELMVDGI